MSHIFKFTSRALVLILALVPSLAHAFAYDTYLGDPVGWCGSLVPYMRHTNAIRRGSNRWAVYVNSTDAWSAIPQDGLTVARTFKTNAAHATYNDDFNSVLVPSAAYFDHPWILGVEESVWDFTDGCIEESDVRVNASSSWNAVDERFADGSAYAVMIHEMGHSIGLQHAGSLSAMHWQMPIAHVGGTGRHTVPLPDDVRGDRFLNGGGSASGAEYDLVTSAQRSVFVNLGYEVRPSNTSFPSTPPGETFDCWVTYGNGGALSASGVTDTIVLRHTVTGVEYVALTWVGATAPAGSFGSLLRTATVPANIPRGANYSVIHRVDPNNAWTEYDESNNSVFNFGTLFVPNP